MFVFAVENAHILEEDGFGWGVFILRPRGENSHEHQTEREIGEGSFMDSLPD